MVFMFHVVTLIILFVSVFSLGKVIVHALDEKARAYYNLEDLWTSDTPPKESVKVNDKLNANDMVLVGSLVFIQKKYEIESLVPFFVVFLALK